MQLTLVTPVRSSLPPADRQPVMTTTLTRRPAVPILRSRVRRLEPWQGERLVAVLAEGFGVDPSVVSAAYPDHVLARPDVLAYVAENDIDGAVCAAVALRNGNRLLIDAVATVPVFQGLGYARAVIDKLLDRAERDGATTAHLQATGETESYFASFGFRAQEQPARLSAA